MTRPLVRAALLGACLAAAPVAAARAQNTTAPAPAASAAAHPNLSGTWELNVTKSSFGAQGGGPTKGTLTIVHAGDKLTRTQMMSSPMGEMSNTMHNTVGAATTDTIRMAGQSMPFTSTTRWDGSTLVVEGKVTMQQTEIPIVGRYTLSPDGKQLMVDQVVTTPVGEQTTHMVFDKKG